VTLASALPVGAENSDYAVAGVMDSSATRSPRSSASAAAGDSQARTHRRRNNARLDGFVSLGVVMSATIVALGFARGDPIVGLTITLVILKVTWDSWRTVSTTDPRRTHRRGPTRNGWNLLAGGWR
jgi:hypothetical protein